MGEWMQMLVAVLVDNLEKDLVRIVTASAVPAAPAVAVPVVVARVAVVVAVAAVQAVGVDAAAAAVSSEVTSETLPLIFRHFLQSTNKKKRVFLNTAHKPKRY